jgi:cytochrome c oxidase subunit IV
MSLDPHGPETATTAARESASSPSEHATYHPSTREYVRVGLILVGLTCLEVWLSYSGLSGARLVGLLLACTLIKFLMVVGYFMHLKFDNGRFSRVFALGAVGAFTLYVVVLLIFGVWGK